MDERLNGLASPNICAIILTYNRKALLADCLEAVLGQSRPCDHVLVLDNASTDGTADMVRQRWGERVTVRSAAHNLGAAGGFNMAMRLGHATDADRLWVMDDDVIPAPDALEALVAAEIQLNERSIDPPFVVSVARDTQGQLTNVPDVDPTANSIGYRNWPDLLHLGLVPVRRSTFVSILLPRATLARYGLPIAAMHIWGEDSEFTLRITRDGPGYLVGSSQVVHVRQQSAKPNIAKENDAARLRYHFYHIRNALYTTRTYHRHINVVRMTIYNVRLAFRLLRAGAFAKAWLVVRGVVAGLTFQSDPEKVDAVYDPALLMPSRDMAEMERQEKVA